MKMFVYLNTIYTWLFMNIKNETMITHFVTHLLLFVNKFLTVFFYKYVKYFSTILLLYFITPINNHILLCTTWMISHWPMCGSFLKFQRRFRILPWTKKSTTLGSSTLTIFTVTHVDVHVNIIIIEAIFSI
jgi:hypothetical protein